MARTDPNKTQALDPSLANPLSMPLRSSTKRTVQTIDLTKTVSRALNSDFRRHGKGAIEALRGKDPAAYLKLCASLQPQKPPRRFGTTNLEALEALENDPLDPFTTEQLHALIDKLDRFLADAGRVNARTTSPPPRRHYGTKTHDDGSTGDISPLSKTI